jgi:hypothetical protein
MPSNTTTITDQTIFAQDTQPAEKSESVIWIDTSDDPNNPRVYDKNTGAWLPVNTTATIVSQTKPAVEPGKIWFEPVSDGINMYAPSNDFWDLIQFLPDAPDTDVLRPQDNATHNTQDERGLFFSTSQNWSNFQARISSNCGIASDEELILSQSGTIINSVDISNNKSGDVITLKNVNLQTNTSYGLYLRSTNNRSLGYVDLSVAGESVPFTSNDGNLSITDGYDTGGSNSGKIWGISEIGNINI